MISLNKAEVIDIHCHTAGIGSGDSGCNISPTLMKSWRILFYLRAFGVTRAEVFEHGDALIINRLSKRLASSELVGSAVILAMDGVIRGDGEIDFEKTEMYVPDDFVAEEVSKYENLLFGASINPYRRDAIERLEKAAENNAVLVKWLPSMQLIDPADSKLTPFYTRIKELGLPLLTHTGHEYSFTMSRNELADPERLRLPLELGVTVIAAHAATTGRNEGIPNLERLIPMFKRYPNLYADISSLTQLNKIGHLRRLLKYTDVHERLLYGTDMPLPETGIVSPFFFAHNIGIGKSISLAGIENPWDLDVGLKLALGVPPEVFTRASKVFQKLHANSVTIPTDML
jgi:hypothetical protein